MGKLFVELLKSTVFYFYDKPGRKLIKSDNSHYIAPEGRRSINPFVLVFEDRIKKFGKSIFDDTNDGENDESE